MRVSTRRERPAGRTRRFMFCTGRLRAVALVALALALAQPVRAAERQFLVILATSPKEFGGQPGELVNPQLINQQYFDKVPGNGIGSFAEYWEEISYGDVTIRGKTTDWINLPWRINRDPDAEQGIGDTVVIPAVINLNNTVNYEYGASELFLTDRAMVIIDLDGDPDGNENGPFSVLDNPPYARGGRDTDPTTGQRVWKPGERFIDMDGDGRWDGLDEARNQMDWSGGGIIALSNGRPDLRGPWVDLNDNGQPENTGDCVYFPDSDNDGNPDCCPRGPGTPECDRDPRDPASGLGPCPPSTWDGPDGMITDCNGNLIDDAADIASGRSADRLPLQSSGDTCDQEQSDGVPDECQFVNWNVDCVSDVVDDPEDPCSGVAVCIERDPPLEGDELVERCEFDDVNGDDELNLVEPYENFLRRWDIIQGQWIPIRVSLCVGGPRNGQLCTRSDQSDENEGCPRFGPQHPPTFCSDLVCRGGDRDGEECTVDAACPGGGTCDRSPGREYVENNYPGHPEIVLRQFESRNVYGERDPLNLVSGSCTCADGTPCIPQVTAPNGQTLLNACVAGVHAQYDPSDQWTEVANSKMYNFDPANPVEGPGRLLDFATTPEPSWYRQAWIDRYGTEPPPWNEHTPLSSPAFARTPQMIPVDDTLRRCFDADAGGRNADGTGWIGCAANLDPEILFQSSAVCPPIGTLQNAFDQQCDAQILPEEVSGIGEPLALFDGRVEHDDLPKSKYHRAGDERLGEVTSPFNTDIWGHDRGDNNPATPSFPDTVIEPAGPYARHIHANFGRDAGNLLHMEVLTWRTKPPFNTGAAWLSDIATLLPGQRRRFHPHAPLRGFRDFNLDGVIDQGKVRVPGSENYAADLNPFIPDNGSNPEYPWNRRRLMEDAISIVDDILDFNDFVDPVAMGAVVCLRAGFPLFGVVPVSLTGPGEETLFVTPSGILSGIVLLPSNAHAPGIFNLSPGFFPIHVEDGLGVPRFTGANLPPGPRSFCSDAGTACATADDCPATESCEPATPFKQQISWHLFVHDLPRALDVSNLGGVIPTGGFLTAFAAHEYLHAWEGFPDLYDYDIFDQPGPVENCPIGAWDIMANGGLVHPVPILKEQRCTGWIKPLDLTTIVTPGVDKVLTLPPAELIRNDSYFFLENEKRPGERFYFWSAGARGFDLNMPGEGMLLLHTDVPLCLSDLDCLQFCENNGDCFCQNGICRGSASNPNAPPAQQRDGTNPAFLIVQADGEDQLQACTTAADGNRGDDGDPWPGSSGAVGLNFEGTTRLVAQSTNNPAAQWRTLGSPTGLEILDVVPDNGSGSVQVTLNWVPTTIPSLRFIDPPGGESVAGVFNARFDVTDVFGGTRVRLFFKPDRRTCRLDSNQECTSNADCPSTETEPNFCRHRIAPPASGTFIQQVDKANAGTQRLSANWPITNVADGRYVLFARLIPGEGTAGGQFEDDHTTPRAGRNNVGDGTLTVNSVAIDDDADDTDDKARLETWSAVCFRKVNGVCEWRVNGTLTQPVLNETDPNADPYPKATTGQLYTSISGEVSFTINAGSIPFEVEDSFTFTTTGFTAVSAPVTITAGQISANPVAKIRASPLSGDPPLTVDFDGRQSFDPNDPQAALNFRWNFGDGSAPEEGLAPSHTYPRGGTFTAVLRVTNTNNGRFGEDRVDIVVTNNSPNAVIAADRTSGRAPLEVVFNGGGSSDRESPPERLIYTWDFGDGSSGVNSARVPGLAFRDNIQHQYQFRADGTPCAAAAPCIFTAELTVIDEGGKEDTDTINIRVGNSRPVPVVSVAPQSGTAPLEVQFDARQTTDADGDDITVSWDFNGDGTTDRQGPLTGSDAVGLVSHTFSSPGTFTPRAVFDDNVGQQGQVTWVGPTITVTQNQPPTADIAVSPDTAAGTAGQTEFTFSGAGSTDVDGAIARFDWNFGDDSAPVSGPREDALTVRHVFDRDGVFTVRLVVADDRGATDEATLQVTINPVPPNETPRAHITTFVNTCAASCTLTFDGSLSFDPDDDPLTHKWEFFQDDSLIDTIFGERVNRTFTAPGQFEVALEVSDGRGGVNRTSRRPIIITEAAPTAPEPEPEPPRPEPPPPDIFDPPDSAQQRPSPICGFGMITGLFGSLLGLVTLRSSRRQWR